MTKAERVFDRVDDVANTGNPFRKKKSLKTRKKGTLAGTFIVLLVGLFVITMFFIIFSRPIEQAYNLTYPMLDNTTSQSTYNIVLAVWDWFIVIVFIGFMIAGIVVAQRRSAQEAYY